MMTPEEIGSFLRVTAKETLVRYMYRVLESGSTVIDKVIRARKCRVTFGNLYCVNFVRSHSKTK